MDKDKIIEALKSMSILEINELVKALEEEFGVSAVAVAAPAAGGAAGGAEGGAEEKSDYNVVLKAQTVDKFSINGILGQACRELVGHLVKLFGAYVACLGYCCYYAGTFYSI